MRSVKDYKVEITKVTEADGGGYIAHIPELDCFGDGETMEKDFLFACPRHSTNRLVKGQKPKIAA